MKKKIILTGIAAVAASATIVGATIGVKSCVDDRKNVTIESATAPVVTLKNGIFYWNQIEGVEGYLVSIDGVVLLILVILRLTILKELMYQLKRLNIKYAHTH